MKIFKINEKIKYYKPSHLFIHLPLPAYLLCSRHEKYKVEKRHSLTDMIPALWCYNLMYIHCDYKHPGKLYAQYSKKSKKEVFSYMLER